jgi:hypothetical protein
MARHEAPREDLLAEATALVERIELQLLGADETVVDPIVVGFRANGAASVFFGQDLAYHFTSTGELRRAYQSARLYKADRGRLASLDRRRTANQVELLQHDLTDAETSEFLGELSRRFRELQTALDAGEFKRLRQIPPEAADLVKNIAKWLSSLPHPVRIARNPRVA